LCVEEQFYFVWPLLVWFTNRRTFPWLCACFIVASLSVGFGFEIAGKSEAFLTMCTFPRVEAIVFGSLIAWVTQSAWWPRCTPFVRLALPVLLGLALVSGLKPRYFRGFFVLQFLVVGLASAALVFCCVTNRNGWIAKIFKDSFLCGFGKYSYAIYCLHNLVFHYVGGWTRAALGVTHLSEMTPLALLVLFLVMTGASFAAGFLSWHLVEKHFLRLRTHFPYPQTVAYENKRTRPSVTPPATPTTRQCTAALS
jgi:peptidoglycan/LPS O-acetylase OafA/YrhL